MFSDTDEEVKYALIDTLKLIISSLKQQKSRCIMLLVSMLLDIFFNVGIAGATNILITSITNRNESAFFEYLIIFSVIGITLALFSIIYPFVQSLIQLSVEQFLSLEIYKSIHEKKYSEVVRFNLSDLISRLIYDSRNLSENLLSNSINILYNVILFFASSLYLFYVQWQLALIIIGSGFVTIFLAKKFSTIQQEISLDLQSTQSERRQYLQDYVTNLDYIKTFQKQDVFLKKYNDIREKENKIVAKKTSTLSLLSFLMNVFN
ncbi:ABC transporter transmembrane domain-containing protein [Alkalibacterium sp. f15]|uniref:ABC transporter transmembrane domain-containing protein n=1 Tax=Alkalibacterium sp. f15 TaxID=3414029 RepID=UPI003BF7A2DA